MLSCMIGDGIESEVWLISGLSKVVGRGGEHGREVWRGNLCGFCCGWSGDAGAVRGRRSMGIAGSKTVIVFRFRKMGGRIFVGIVVRVS